VKKEHNVITVGLLTKPGGGIEVVQSAFC